jgi:hypothetical protein
MMEGAQDRREGSGWGFPASVAVHLLVVFLVIFGLPVLPLQPQEEQAVEVDLVPPPEQAPEKPEPEEEKPEPPPPPEPEKPKEPEKPEEPEQAQVEPPAAAPDVPLPVFRPVFQFGEKDAGPREALDGNSGTEGPDAPELPRQADAPDEMETAEPETAAPEALTADGAQESIAPAEAAEVPVPEPRPEPTPEDIAKAEQAAEEARKLASQHATGDVIATTAMEEVPRGVRAGRLCTTELREQMRDSMPPYFPDILPSYRLGEGTILDVPRAAFRVGGDWYDLAYRCQVDANATKVVGFFFRVGERLPPSEQQRRGLPIR